MGIVLFFYFYFTITITTEASHMKLSHHSKIHMKSTAWFLFLSPRYSHFARFLCQICVLLQFWIPLCYTVLVSLLFNNCHHPMIKKYILGNLRVDCPCTYLCTFPTPPNVYSVCSVHPSNCQCALNNLRTKEWFFLNVT
jgi:hypothetical protein